MSASDSVDAVGIGSEKELRVNTFIRRKQNSEMKDKRSNKHKCRRRRFMNDVKASCKLETIGENDIVLDPQFGLESVTSASFAIEALAKFAKIDVPEKIIREVEGILYLLITLSQQTSIMGVMPAILLWANGRFEKSLITSISDYVGELFVEPQSNLNTTPDWLECLRDTRQNWELCKSNRAFKQVSKLLGCLVTLGLCDVSQLTFNVGQFKVFTPELCDKHMSAFDMADAVFETVIFFTEGAYLCYQSGSLKPLLINDRTAMELDHEYAQVTAWFELVKNGNLNKFAQMTDQEFEKRLNRLSTSLSNLAQSLRGPEKKLVMDKFQKVLIMQNNFITMKIASGVRHAPWAIELFGESCQGKTTLGDQLIDAVLTSQQMPVKKEFRCAYNAGDKFMSNWTSDKLVMIFDDISNDKSDFVERPPTRAIIDVVNNQMFYAPKAELEAKGKCFVEPWIAMATTNKKNLDADLYSNCPYSIQRRLICLTVSAKIEFQRMENGTPCGIDPTKVRKHYTKDGEYTPPMFDDIWTVTIEKAVKPQDLSVVARYAPIVWRGKRMVDISMSECIQWAIEDFDDHKKNQEALLAGIRLRENSMVLCPVKGCIQLKGNCPDHVEICLPCSDDECDDFADSISFGDFCSHAGCMNERGKCPLHIEPQFGHETVATGWKLWYKSETLKNKVEELYDRVDHDASVLIYKKGTEFLDRFDWIKIVPAPILDHKDASWVIKWLYKDRFTRDYNWEVRRIFYNTIFFVLFAVLLFRLHWSLTAMLLKFSVLYYLIMMRNIYEYTSIKFVEDLKQRNMCVAPMVRKYRDDYAKHICMASIGLAVLYGLARAYRAYKEIQPQGSLEPKTQMDIDQRDSEINPWTSIVKRELPITDFSKRVSPDQLDNCVKKAMLYCTIAHPDGNGMANVLMVASNVMMIPNHYFTQFGDNLECTFRKLHPEASGGKFASVLSLSASYLIPGSDLRLCYTTTGGSFKNLVNYFPIEHMPSVPFRMHWRKKDGDLILAKGLTKPQVVTTVADVIGGLYKNLTINTFDGLCGATLLSETNGSVIIGMHIGGTSGTPIGCYNSITQQELKAGFDALRSIEGVLLSGGAGKFETTVLGVQILKSDDLHVKSPLNYLPHNSQVEYLGSCIGRSVSVTSVQVTPISEHVMMVCNEPNIYHGPKFHPEYAGWQECLSNLSVPATPFYHDELMVSVIDYKEPLLKIFRSELWRHTTPLLDHENLCGIPGRKFVDAINLNTSVGFPLSGPKRKFVTEMEPTEEWPCNRELESVLVDEIARIEDCYKRGERGYPIAKACKKDEVVSKDKCRIMYGNALSLTFLLRKYYLPILRVLQMNPLVSECAVGINSHGPEWEELHKHITTFGMDRLFGGDYGKYDQKLPAQLILAGLRILIDFARECDYSEADISIMEAMTGDLVYAYIAFNGDLIGLTEGTHISGNSLTAVLNGICGSLNLRCYFYNKHRPASIETRLKFRDYVKISTYGDDNIGSVSKKLDNFTIRGCSKFLEEKGQIYTMPDKESELADFLREDELEFLKRQSVYHPKLGRHLGALLDKSIYKSLHCFMREKNSPITKETACAINIDGALREWFNHGEEKYEAQRLLMQEVAKRANLTYLCTGLDLSYNDRVANWVAQYDSNNVTSGT